MSNFSNNLSWRSAVACWAIANVWAFRSFSSSSWREWAQSSSDLESDSKNAASAFSVETMLFFLPFPSWFSLLSSLQLLLHPARRRFRSSFTVSSASSSSSPDWSSSSTSWNVEHLEKQKSQPSNKSKKQSERDQNRSQPAMMMMMMMMMKCIILSHSCLC